MTIDSLKSGIDQLANWWPGKQEIATEPNENSDWLGWDGWVSVGVSHTPTSE